MHDQTRGYNMVTDIVTSAQRIVVVKDCFSFMFTNVGDTIAFVNGLIVHPSTTPATSLGDSRTIGAHRLDLFKGSIIVSFQAPVGLNPKLEVVQLFYIDNYNK